MGTVPALHSNNLVGNRSRFTLWPRATDGFILNLPLEPMLASDWELSETCVLDEADGESCLLLLTHSCLNT